MAAVPHSGFPSVFLRSVRQRRHKGHPFRLDEHQRSSPSSSHGLFRLTHAPSWCGSSAGVRSLTLREGDLLLWVSRSLVKTLEPEEEQYPPPLDRPFQKHSLFAESCPLFLFGDCNYIGVWWCEQLFFSLAHWPNCNRGGKIFSLPSPPEYRNLQREPGREVSLLTLISLPLPQLGCASQN